MVQALANRFNFIHVCSVFRSQRYRSMFLCLVMLGLAVAGFLDVPDLNNLKGELLGGCDMHV